jgi:hypothetical protein
MSGNPAAVPTENADIVGDGRWMNVVRNYN